MREAFKGEQGQIRETIDLIFKYLKQETLTPLKSILKFALFGLSGAIFLGAGAILVLLGILRLLQSETGSSFTGNLTWLPYLITLGIAAIVAFVAIRVGKINQRRSRV